MTKLETIDENIQKHAQWEMSANIKGVKLSALCVTEAHREKTLKHWRRMKAENIQIFERENAPAMLTWKVTIPTNRHGETYLTLTASSEESARTQLSGMKYAKWQQYQAKIELVQPEQPALFAASEPAQEVKPVEQPKEETPAIEPVQEVTTEETPAIVETEQPTVTVEQEVQPVKEETPVDHYKTAKQFVSRMRKTFSNNSIEDLDNASLETRLQIIQGKIEFHSRLSNPIPRAYDPAAYGLLWTVRRGTINSETYNALKAMTAAQLCELIHIMLVESGENAGDYAQWLMNRFSPKQPEATNQPDMSSIEVTQSNISPEKTACTKTLDTIVNIRHNIDTTITLDHTEEEKAMTQVMTTDQITLSPEQQTIFNLIENTKENAFITGKAGTGKSVLIRHFKANTKKKAAFVAPTGIAALNIKASTIHSMFKLDHQFQQRWNLSPDRKLNTLLRNLDVLVIDEISMVRCDIMDAINWRFQQAMENDLPFGGKQVVMIGDVYQLPPVLDRSDDFQKAFRKIYAGGFFFDALVWQNGGTFKVFELTQVFRQKDPMFRDALNAMRDGTITDEQLSALNARHGMDAPIGTECITLGSTNKIVADINQQQLDRLPGSVKRYYATIWGNMKQSNFPTEEILQLKEGAQIMMLKNNKDKGWVNGTLGIIEKLSDDAIEVSIAGKSHTIERETWEEIEYRYDEERDELTSRVTSSFTQYPVKLAWGMTIHKSQGQTYQQVRIDLTTGVFAAGQMYVALSRATSLEGLYLKRPILRKHVMVDARVKQFMSRVETIVIEEPVIVDAAPVIEAAEEIIQIAQIQPSEAPQPVVVESNVETPASTTKKGRKPKSEEEKVIKTDTHLPPMIREGLDRLMAKLKAEETTNEERARMIPHSAHTVPSISDVVIEALLKLEAFREVNPGLEAAYEEKRGKKK